MAKKKKVIDESEIDVQQSDMELETQADELTEVQGSEVSNEDEETLEDEEAKTLSKNKDDNVLSTADKPKDMVEENEAPLVLKDEIPIDDVPIRDLPGFGVGSRLDPNNPHDVRYARQQLKRLRAQS